MSWSNSLLSPSDDFYTNSTYPHESTETNIVPAPLEPNEGPYPFTFEQPYATRLSSPRNYTLFPVSSSTSSVPRLRQLPRPEPDASFDNTLRDVQSALHNADMALRNAQAAFRHGRATRSNTSNIVDLTGSDDVEETTSIQENRYLETQSQTRFPERPAMRVTARSVGDIDGLRERQQLLDRNQRRQQGEIDISLDSDSGDDGDGDNDYESQEADNSDMTIRMPSIRQILPQGVPSGPGGNLAQASVQADRSAVRRQRQARRDWERVERRNRERAHQQAQTDAQNNSQISQVDANEEQSQSRRNPQRQNSNASASGTSILSLDNKIPSESEPVDLTGADDDKTLKNILAKEQQDAIAAQAKSPPSNSTTASSLSNYKCAICMDSPTNATTTICGHLFCHRCILDSLKWSERQRREDALRPHAINGLCPVCRKPLKNKEVSNAGRSTAGGLVNLEIKKIPRKQYNDDRQREKFLADIEGGKDKGKQRANTDDVVDIENLEPRDGGSDGLGQGQRKRRRVQS